MPAGFLHLLFFFSGNLVIKALNPLKIDQNNLPIVDTKTMQSSHPNVWCGGDIAGVSETTVESVNDGKTAAWYIHCYLEVCITATVKEKPHQV